MKHLLLFVLVSASALCCQPLLAHTAEDLEALVRQNVAVTEIDDVEKTLATTHTQSPIYATQARLSQQINEIYDLKYEVLAFNYVGQDKDYAYARFTLKTTKVEGPEFRDNQLEALASFKKEEGVWKPWNQMTLSVRFE